MYPNQPPQAPSTLPVDYLNQIAPQGPKKTPFRFNFGLKQVAVIAVVLISLVIILAVIVNSFAGGKKDPLEHLSARLTATQVIVTTAQPNLKSSQLRSLNSNLNLYMTNTNRDITGPLTSAGLDVKKLSKSVVAAESTTALSSRLEDARLNGVFDRTYAREMAFQLGTMMTLMNQIYSSTSNAALKTFLESAYSNLKPTQESFANFTAAD